MNGSRTVGWESFFIFGTGLLGRVSLVDAGCLDKPAHQS